MVVLKQLGAGPELVHCHATLTIEAFMRLAVTSVGVGGAEVRQQAEYTCDASSSSKHTLNNKPKMKM